MNFKTSEADYFLPDIILIAFVTALLIILSVITINTYRNNLLNILTFSVSLFLITYVPILDYWSIWYGCVWPDIYAPADFVTLHFYGNDQLLYDLLYVLLTLLSQFLLFYSIIIFIFYINSKHETSVKWKRIHWIPFVNIIPLSLSISKLIKGNWFFTLVIITWSISSFLWLYYRYAALFLALIHIDSYSFIDHLLFGNRYEESVKDANPEYLKSIAGPLDYPLSFLVDLTHMIVPVFLFTAGVMQLILILKLKKADLSLEK